MQFVCAANDILTWVISLLFLKVVPSLDYIVDLIYNGYYCFELLTVHSLDNQI